MSGSLNLHLNFLIDCKLYGKLPVRHVLGLAVQRLYSSGVYKEFHCRWGILFSHPADFTPVCTTELGAVASLVPEFAKRNVKCIALSCDPVDSHHNWIKDIQAYNNLAAADFPFPIISDPNRDIAIQLGMLDPSEKDKSGLPLTARAVRRISTSYKFYLLFLLCRFSSLAQTRNSNCHSCIQQLLDVILSKCWNF